jgi:hypothetical protein
MLTLAIISTAVISYRTFFSLRINLHTFYNFYFFNYNKCVQIYNAQTILLKWLHNVLSKSGAIGDDFDVGGLPGKFSVTENKIEQFSVTENEIEKVFGN